MNVNDIVTVKLTDYGKSILDNYRFSLEKDSGLEFKTFLICDKDNKYTSELWNIMSIFGKYFYVGSNQIFVNNEINLK